MHGPICVAIIEHTEKILILRQRNLSKHCLLRFPCLSIKITSQHVPYWKAMAALKTWIFVISKLCNPYLV